MPSASDSPIAATHQLNSRPGFGLSPQSWRHVTVPQSRASNAWSRPPATLPYPRGWTPRSMRSSPTSAGGASTSSPTWEIDDDTRRSTRTTQHERPPIMTSTTTTPVALDVDGGTARLRLNRPEASNGLDVELLQALHGAILRCHADPAVRVVLLSGAGRNFGAGGDLKTFESKVEHLPDYLREATAWLQLATSAL